MKLSIIIVNFKKPALLRLCLKSLERAVSRDLEHEIIVVDVASTHQTRTVVTEEFLPILSPTQSEPQNRGSSIFQSNQNDLGKIGTKAKLLPFKENIGYTRGVNEGIKASSGEYCLILNPDVVPLKGSLEVLRNYLQENPDAGMAGPQLLNFDGTPQNSCFRFYDPFVIAYRRTFLGKTPWGKKKLDRFVMKDKDLNKTAEVDWLMGSAVMVSKKAAKKVGPMDENLFLYMSDVDWPRRFWENHYKVVYIPEAKMYHYHPRDSKGRLGVLDIFFKKELRWHIRDAIKYFNKWHIHSTVKR